MKYYVGIDIGSTSAKTTVLDENGQVVSHEVRPTGWSSVDTAEAIRADLETRGITTENSFIVATGYGRVSVPYANHTVTEITCHGQGAAALFGLDSMTIIDIGGQDTKIICLRDGMVQDFMMNDKCSAGTGRFLEVMANSLSVTPDDLCRMAEASAQDADHVSISSLCTVFAESEVISLIGQGVAREKIAYAIIDSIVKKVASQADRLVDRSLPVCLTGGLCESPYICEALGKAVKAPISTLPEARYAGAMGAAVIAGKKAGKKA